MKFNCRHCNENLDKEIINLGNQPASNAYLNEPDLSLPEINYPLKVYICKKCWLMQIPQYATPKELFTKDYAYFSSTSTSWVNHARLFVKDCIDSSKINKDSFVVEIASNDGYLLDFVNTSKIDCLGIEPTLETSLVAKKKGIKTINKFFSSSLVSELISNNLIPNSGADLVIANNVLAHVPDINDFMKGLSQIISREGFISIEFPHLLKLIKYSQFDTIYHEHFSYLSLNFILKISSSVGLQVVEVEELNTHGGSLRVWLKRKIENNNEYSNNLIKVLNDENNLNLQTLDTYKKLQKEAEKIKDTLLKFLIEQKERKIDVYAYGAAAKGNTLLNFSGIRSDLIKAVADKSKTKQGKFLPGSHIPIIRPEELFSNNPEKIIILPWNIADEIVNEYKGFEFYVPIPEFRRI